MQSVVADWLAELAEDLATGVETGLPLVTRGGQVAAVLAGSLAADRVLCDLLGAQGGLLERNVVCGARRPRRCSSAPSRAADRGGRTGGVERGECR